MNKGNGSLNGFIGKQLRVDLTKGVTSTEKLNPELARKFLGGVGYGVKLLYDELSPTTDPLSTQNKLVFATGPLTGTAVPGSGSVEICFKSPLTGAWSEARCGSDWGPLLKKAGYDYLILEGKSEKPVQLVINNEQIEIKPADSIKGKTTSEKQLHVEEELGDEDFEVATIGVAGENLVNFSSIMIGGRAAGRCGAGAVMGSKNLLAVSVRGDKEIPIANPDKFLSTTKDAINIVSENEMSSAFREDGTTGDMPFCDETGDWPAKNWKSNSWGKAEEIYDQFKENNFVTNKACYTGCIMPCGRISKVDSGKWKTPEHEGSEYETISAFTAFVLNENVDAAVHASYLCNEFGLDTISTGASIAFAMDCFEEGIITKSDTEGLELNWGNTDSMIELIKKIANKKGIGKVLSKGVRDAAQEFGQEARELAIHGKGLEPPAHDPRSGKALAVTYGTANRGMCHIHPIEAMAYDKDKMDFGLSSYGLTDPDEVNKWDEVGKGREVKILQDGGIIADILGTCKFYIYAGLNPDHYAEMLSALTGWKVDGKELMAIGERVFNLQRLFNVREGFSRVDDTLPNRMKKVPEFGAFEGNEECAIEKFDDMLNEYYVARGWNNEGIPKESKLKEMGLEKEFKTSL